MKSAILGRACQRALASIEFFLLCSPSVSSLVVVNMSFWLWFIGRVWYGIYHVFHIVVNIKGNSRLRPLPPEIRETLDNRKYIQIFFVESFSSRRNTTMRQDIIGLALYSLTALSIAGPIEPRSVNNNVIDEFESIDSFPAPVAQQLLSIEQRGHGTLSNSTPPASIDPDTIVSLQVIAAQEQFEAAFFQQLLTNITNNELGYVIGNRNAQKLAINSLAAIVAVCATC